MKQERVEKDLIECQRLLTRAVTDLPEFSTMEKIKANNTEFLRACDRVHKQAQRILIAETQTRAQTRKEALEESFGTTKLTINIGGYGLYVSLRLRTGR